VNISGLEATASVAESDAAKIQVGDAATVTIPALTDTELPAHVVSVDEIGATSSSVVEYTVTVALDRPDKRLKPGMTANVSVTTAERDNVLNVPSAAVTGSGSNATVLVVGKNGAQTRVRVVAGLQGDTSTEIVSGLHAGQTVVTSTGRTAATSGPGGQSTAGNGRFGGLGGLFGGGGGGGRSVVVAP
jgi:macrolide-specific efflux system membrane fusion protein